MDISNESHASNSNTSNGDKIQPSEPTTDEKNNESINNINMKTITSDSDINETRNESKKIEIYVIGSNLYSELTFNKDKNSILELTKLSWYQTKFIQNIYCSNCVNIYCNHKLQKYCICGKNDVGQCGIDSDKHNIDKLWDITYFQKHNIKIKDIFCNISGSTIFWLTDNNLIYGMGANEYYQLGLGENSNKYKPVPVSIPATVFNTNNKNINIISIQCSGEYSIALGDNGNVYSTGDIKHSNYYNEDNKTWKIMEIFTDNNTKIVKIQSGHQHSLFLSDTGSLYSCGKNNYYQLGFGTIKNDILKTPKIIPYFIENVIKIKDIKCGNDHNIVLTEYGKVFSFGCGDQGQCGHGIREHVKIPQRIKELDECDVINIGCGALHSYCLTSDGKHYLWGSNSYNECLELDDEDCVLLPKIINDKVDRQTHCNKIVEVLLGWENTQVIVQ
eukprot:70304_1